MIELKKEFTKRGTEYKQVYKDSCLAVYRISRCSEDNNKPYHWYEVFRIYRKAPDKYHKDEYEKYPFDEAFGSWAWSCSNEESVKKIIKEHFKGHEGLLDCIVF